MSDIRHLIKSCPFCGEDNAVICNSKGHLDPPAYAVSCRTRECHGGIFALGYGEFPTEEAAIIAWNTRADNL